ncbi:MAG: L,D-transpeptidase family protein [Chitinophagaceae bacterium]|jgi:murein L,D-transpeptidase YcbB/YkuD|nr:L,D-transpeptidase family protein [Chitinophagaceae bacterium]
MKIALLIICISILSFISACSDNNAREVFVNRDTTITSANAITDLFIDSTLLELYIDSNKTDEANASLMRNFYKSRNYQYAWFTSKGLAQQANAFWNLHNHFISYSQDSSLHNDHLHQLMDELMIPDSIRIPSTKIIRQTELQLTDHFFKYAHYAFNGKIDPEEFKWYIPRKKIDAVSLLDSLIEHKGKDIDNWAPVNSLYKHVKDNLLVYYEWQKNKSLPVIGPIENTLRKGDSADILPAIKQYLSVTGDLAHNDDSQTFNDEFEKAVKRFQKRFGLKQDGVIGKDFSTEINVSVQKRIEQLLVNLERMRWLPPRPGGTFIVANIPAFRLLIFENKKKVFESDIVVGKEGTGTVIFTDSLKYIVFSPYWNLPASIVRNEIEPAIHRNPNYLQRNNMEITGYNNGLPVIRQKPGSGNALGLVKFIFPNNYNIYFHDTPSKYLFERDKRAFSHGCIRVRKPEEMANYLLKNQPEWTQTKINAAMHAGEEKWVTLKTSVPVFITYFTAWVDEDNLLHFRDDIYGHDKKLADRLFTQ